MIRAGGNTMWDKIQSLWNKSVSRESKKLTWGRVIIWFISIEGLLLIKRRSELTLSGIVSMLLRDISIALLGLFLGIMARRGSSVLKKKK
jgi:hypothetical protein